MSGPAEERLVVRGETWITLESAASCFEVDVHVLQAVYARGLLGEGERSGASIAIPARSLDRVAAVVRLHVVHHLDLDLVEVLLTS